MRTARQLAIAFVVALVAIAAQAAPALAAKAATLSGYDTLTATGGRALLRFKLERRNLIRWDLPGVRVEFRMNGALLGTVRTAGDGYADLTVPVGNTAGDLVITGRTAPGERYAAPERSLLLCVRAPGARIVVTDIDWTICGAGWSSVLSNRNADIPPVKGAVAGIRDVAKDATVVYVTARDDYFLDRTKAWLGHWGFVRGPVIFSDDARTLFSARPYKSAAIRALKRAFANVPCGFGDLKTDAQAYHDNGLESFIFDTHGQRDIPSYARLFRDWDDLRAANAAGRTPGLAWATALR